MSSLILSILVWDMLNHCHVHLPLILDQERSQLQASNAQMWTAEKKRKAKAMDATAAAAPKKAKHVADASVQPSPGNSVSGEVQDLKCVSQNMVMAYHSVTCSACVCRVKEKRC